MLRGEGKRVFQAEWINTASRHCLAWLSWPNTVAGSSCHLTRGQMNQDYVRPKSQLCLSIKLGQRTDRAGSQSTRWSLTVRYLRAKKEKRDTPHNRPFVHIYNNGGRPDNIRPNLSLPPKTFSMRPLFLVKLVWHVRCQSSNRRLVPHSATAPIWTFCD